MGKRRVLVAGLGLIAVTMAVAVAAGDAPPDGVWRTYRNAEYGYELRYPDELAVWPTGPEEQRDGRTIRVARKEYAAPLPVLDIAVKTGSRSALEAGVELPDLAVTTSEVELDGGPARVRTYRWRVNGEVAFVAVRGRDVSFTLHVQAGVRDVEGTVWWRVIESFRSVDR